MFLRGEQCCPAKSPEFGPTNGLGTEAGKARGFMVCGEGGNWMWSGEKCLGKAHKIFDI